MVQIPFIALEQTKLIYNNVYEHKAQFVINLEVRKKC